MAMTKLEVQAKKEILKLLASQGYPTYARLLSKFDINLTSDPGVIGYMNVDKARIVLNRGLNIKQVSTIVRHEILHEYLTHFARSEKFKKENPKYKDVSHDLINRAADFDISNVGYTSEDKAIARAIELNDKILTGLVTEYDYPEWQDKTFEELIELLADEEDSLINDMKKSIQIGDTGDKNIQDAEELERQANAISDDAGEEINNSKSDDISDDYQDIKDTVDDISDKASDLKKASEDAKDTSNVFDSDKEVAKQEKIAKRIADLKKDLQDAVTKKNLLDETNEPIAREIAAKKARDLKKYKESALVRFADSLNNFIKNEISTGRGSTWTRINKKYSGTGIIKPGSSRLQQTKIPLINVYFDRSASWDSEKTVEGSKAISTLNKYVNQGKIKINLYYFSDKVYSNENDAIINGFSTRGQPILDHIEDTKPTNVIILTDSDISDCRSEVSVPGGVWMLFYDGRSQNLINSLKGKKLTRYFDIEYK